jgi:copper(I)-binding protein
MLSLKKLFYCSFTVVTLCFGIYAHAQEEDKNVVVTNAWVRVMPPVQKNTAAYMTIENKTDKEFILKSVATDVAGEVQMHLMEHINGMMKMRKVDEISVPAQNQVELKPGGFHLMLLNLIKPIKEGDVISIVLRFQGGTIYTCPMHAEIRQEEVGDCPKCGMALELANSTITVNALAKSEGMDHE